MVGRSLLGSERVERQEKILAGRILFCLSRTHHLSLLVASRGIEPLFAP